MMGQQLRTEPLFDYFRLEDQIPDDHLLKRLDRWVDFRFVRERLRDAYSPLGRPSIDPEILRRMLLVGYLYGITSERRLVEEVRMHLAYRWLTRLGFEQEIPDRSSLSTKLSHQALPEERGAEGGAEWKRRENRLKQNPKRTHTSGQTSSSHSLFQQALSFWYASAVRDLLNNRLPWPRWVSRFSYLTHWL
jgi:transposase